MKVSTLLIVRQLSIILKLSSTEAPQFYEGEKNHGWVQSKPGDNLSSSHYNVRLIEEPLELNSHLKHHQQRAIFDQVLKNHPQIEVLTKVFDPKLAISVKNSNRFDSALERVEYPCSDFSPSFSTQKGPKRPVFELEFFYCSYYMVGRAI